MDSAIANCSAAAPTEDTRPPHGECAWHFLNTQFITSTADQAFVFCFTSHHTVVGVLAIQTGLGQTAKYHYHKSTITLLVSLQSDNIS